MDYGPFGFLEAYEPLWSPFTSDMERKFGFERQPLAAQVNLMTLARAVLSMFVALDGDQLGPNPNPDPNPNPNRNPVTQQP